MTTTKAGLRKAARRIPRIRLARTRPFIPMYEQTSDSPRVARRSRATLRTLKAAGAISNPRDRRERLYRKGR